MSDLLENALKSHSAALDLVVGRTMFGTVTSVDYSNSMVRVAMQPGNVLSGWLPVLSQWTGNGWGLVCPLNPGDQVLVVPQDGDSEQGIVVGRAFSTTQRPPQAPADEFWIVHKSGTSLKLCNDGTVRLHGDLHVQGDVFDSKGPLSRLRTTYNAHTHITSSGQKTGPPVQLD